MQITWQEVIDRARTYLDDDHNDRKGFLTLARWLSLAGVEYRQLRHRWIRSGLIGPEPVDQEFTGPEVSISGVHGIMGVIKANGLQFSGATFDVSAVWPTFPFTLTAKPSSSRVTVQFQGDESATAGLVETGTDAVITVQTGVTTTSDFLFLMASSTLFTLSVNDGADVLGTEVVATDVEWLGTVRALTGGDIRVTGDWYELRSSQLTKVTKDWRTYDSSRESNEWEAFGVGDKLRLRVFPEDSSGTYIVRYFETVASPTDPDAFIEVPDGGDERLVLGLVRRAAVKESGASAAVNQLIMDADAELNFDAARKGGGLRMRDAKLRTNGFWSRYSLDWWYFRT